jgi:hypothetical protein
MRWILSSAVIAAEQSFDPLALDPAVEPRDDISVSDAACEQR